MPGPLPAENPRRRNKRPPTDQLPADGVELDVPEPIEELDDLERRYYDWAWSTPAAAAWHDSDAEVVAEWARLKAYATRCLRGEIEKQSATTGRMIIAELSTAVLSQITVREDRLFLSPAGRKKGRTKIVDGEPAEKPSTSHGNVVTPDRWKRTG